MKLREKQTLARRKRILDTAERLIRKTQGTDFSVRRLASLSEVSPTTPYNLFGSKEGLLYALLDRTIDYVTSEEGSKFQPDNPALTIIAATSNAVDMFATDPDFLKPLYKVLLGVNDPVHRPLFMRRSLSYWRSAVKFLPRSRFLRTDAQRDMLAHAAETHFLGLLEYWVHGEVDVEGLHSHAMYGTLLMISGVVEGALKERVDALFLDATKEFSPHALRP